MRKTKSESKDAQGDGAPSAAVEMTLSENTMGDFSPEQWAWLKAESASREGSYVPTRSLLPGL